MLTALLLPLLHACDFEETARSDAAPSQGPVGPAMSLVNPAEFVGEIGTVQEIDPPAECEADRCTRLEVTCSGAIEPAVVELLINREESDVHRGTVVFTSGGRGKVLWSEFSTYAATVIDRLERDGYRTVQTRYESSWPTGTDLSEGLHNLACRGATIYKYIHDTYAADQAFCATANSGGSSLLAYAMSHYGLDPIFDLAVPSGGPTHSRVDHGCLGGTTTKEEELEYPFNSKASVDESRGFDREVELGTCEEEVEADRGVFEEMSIVLSGLDFSYPDTRIHLVTGEDDTLGSGVPQSTSYFHRVRDEGGNDISRVTVRNTGHKVPKFKEGAIEIYNAILDFCSK